MSTSTNSHTPPNHKAASASGARTTLEAMRKPSVRHDPASQLRSAWSATRGAVAPVAAVELAHRVAQALLVEVRPQRLGEYQLGVGRLPQQEVGQALLAGGADQQVGIGNVDGLQVARVARLIDFIGAQPTRR